MFDGDDFVIPKAYEPKNWPKVVTNLMEEMYNDEPGKRPEVMDIITTLDQMASELSKFIFL